MKKIYLLPCAALLALSSCTNEINEEGFVDKTNAISFNAYSNKTRAYEGGDVDIAKMKEGSFGVVGYNNTDHNLYLGTANKATEQVWNNEHSTWDYKNQSDMKYWPGGTMDFFAYFPYSDNGATFSETNITTGSVMTINCTGNKHDVLFSHVSNKSQEDRVHLYFHHALSKIKEVQIQVNAADVSVEVSNIEILNSYTQGTIEVGSNGIAKYSGGSESRKFSISPARTITNRSTEAERTLFDNNANGYLFATNATEHEYVIGTGQDMWNGTKDALNGGTLPSSNYICMKLTCKVIADRHYLVGSADTYGDMYIPMKGTSANSAEISELLAGRRYTYKIVMTSNVGYKEDGEPIMLSYIKFGVNQVYDWNDVTVTINL